MTLQKNISIKLTDNRESYQVTAGPATPGIEKKVQGYPIKECRWFDMHEISFTTNSHEGSISHKYVSILQNFRILYRVGH